MNVCAADYLYFRARPAQLSNSGLIYLDARDRSGFASDLRCRTVTNRNRDLLHLRMDNAVGSQAFQISWAVGLTGKIGDLASGFTDEQDSCGGIPRLEAEFPEEIEASASHIGQPSNCPHATEHRSSAAAPARRTPWERSVNSQ